MAESFGRKQAYLGQTAISRAVNWRSELAGGIMPTSRAALTIGLVSATVVSLTIASTAVGALSATAIVSTNSSASPYDYTIDLHNTGTTNIGTLWFAWDAGTDYNFLPTSPTNIVAPSGWTAPISHLFPGDGYGIEYYNLGGSAIAPGAHGLFQFTSTDSPATLAGNAYLPPFKVTSSFVYTGFPLGDAGFKFNASVAVPEPAGLTLAGIGIATAFLTWRGRQASVAAR
jgi:hypothetical protein